MPALKNFRPSSDQESVPIPGRASKRSLDTVSPDYGLRGGASPAETLRRLRNSIGWRTKVDAVARRGLDLGLSAFLLVVLSPIIVVSVIVIKLDTPGPVFYRAGRVGFRGRTLRMLKFRKMPVGTSGAKLTASEDERLTRSGVWLTRLKIDEIPQLIHVVRGEMSLVGPRPEDPEFVEMMRDDYDLILEVKPGITGYSQLAFAEESRILDSSDPLSHYVGRLFPQKMGLDMMYARDQGLRLNLKILLWTVAAVVLRRAVAVNRQTGKMNLRKR
jgi:lipopolysaccharide/colanic/teichoic acid biosynthesis glycosyltransferase